jgi:hypothetical protein
VISALTWGLGLDVPSDNVTVVQSSLNRDELRALLLGSDMDDPPDIPVVPETPPTASTPTASLPTTSPPTASPPPDSPPPDSPPPDSTDPDRSVPDTGLLEFSLGGAQGEAIGQPEDLRRLELEDLQLVKNPQGGFSISVRLADDGRSMGVQLEAAGTEEDLLEVPANAALDVIQQFLRAGREDGPSVVLRFLAARRLRHPQHDTVVVLVEAVVRGRQIPLTGAATVGDGVERASILATLQATNAFVAGSLI